MASSTRTGIVADHWALAVISITVAKSAKADTSEGRERDVLDDGCRERREEEQDESGEEQDGQRRGRAQHVCLPWSTIRLALASRAAEEW